MVGDKGFTFTDIACDELPDGMTRLRFLGTCGIKLVLTFTPACVEITHDKALALTLQKRTNAASEQPERNIQENEARFKFRNCPCGITLKQEEYFGNEKISDAEGIY